MPNKYTFPRDRDRKSIQVKVTYTQFLALAWLVEKGKGKTVSNLTYLAINEYVNKILAENPALANKLFKYIEKISKTEPIFKMIGKPFDLIPQKTT